MKYLIMLVLSAALLGCTDASTTDVSRQFNMPYELKDCRLIRLTPDGMSSDRVYVLNCPDGLVGTSSSIPSGKTRHNTSVIPL